MDTYVEQKRFKAYLYRIAGNVCMDWFRKNSVQFAGEELLETIVREDSELVWCCIRCLLYILLSKVSFAVSCQVSQGPEPAGDRASRRAERIVGCK